MAVGIPFPESNLTLTAPTPEDAAAGTVYDLHVHRYTDLDGQANVISKWQFAPEELAGVVANGGTFWFHCWGHTHPPIAIFGDSPFVRAGQKPVPAAEPEERPNAADWRNRAERAEAECAELRARSDAMAKLHTPRPLSEWSEDYGDVLWHLMPIQEAPWIGGPLDSSWPYSPEDDDRLWFTPLPICNEIVARFDEIANASQLDDAA